MPADRRAAVPARVPPVDVYAVLGVPPDADAAALKAAHRALVRRHHPDLAPPEARADATRRVTAVNVAYGLVRDPAARARYDALRAAAARSPAEDRSRQWDALTRDAGRWAGRWWRQNREPLRRAAGGARRVAAATLGRVLWLLSCIVWAGIGFVAATAGARLLGVDAGFSTATGLIGGGLVGSARGWRRRLALAGVEQPATLPGRYALPLAAAALTAVLAAEAILGGR